MKDIHQPQQDGEASVEEEVQDATAQVQQPAVEAAADSVGQIAESASPSFSSSLSSPSLTTETAEGVKMLMDDYIAAREPITDYLTRYSGIHEGDLDPSTSPVSLLLHRRGSAVLKGIVLQHAVTTLKAAYLRLRHLIDRGCVFVGHGLQKDFRILNIKASHVT